MRYRATLQQPVTREPREQANAEQLRGGLLQAGKRKRTDHELSRLQHSDGTQFLESQQHSAKRQRVASYHVSSDPHANRQQQAEPKNSVPTEQRSLDQVPSNSVPPVIPPEVEKKLSRAVASIVNCRPNAIFTEQLLESARNINGDAARDCKRAVDDMKAYLEAKPEHRDLSVLIGFIRVRNKHSVLVC